jgi:hypothetical protein
MITVHEIHSIVNGRYLEYHSTCFVQNRIIIFIHCDSSCGKLVGDIGHLTFRYPSTTFVGVLSFIVSLPFLSLELLTTHHDAYDLL